MNLIAHVEIPVHDLERAKRFYSHVFGLHFGDDVLIHGNRMAYFPFEAGHDGASGALVQGEVYRPTTDGAIVYLAVDNIDEAITRATSTGSEILFPKTAVSDEVCVAEIRDSEGNRIAIQISIDATMS